MPEFNVRADSVDVEQIMEQIRARIRDKRGVDYTEQQIRELATVKLEKILDSRGLRSDLLEQFKQAQTGPRVPPDVPAPIFPHLPRFEFEAETLYGTHRWPLRLIRRLLRPVLKLFFNPNQLIHVLHLQSKLNERAEAEREWHRERDRVRAQRDKDLDQLRYEVIHNLVMETTRLGIDVKTLKMRVESLTSRLEFNERRARALESVVVYKPDIDEDPETSAPTHAPLMGRDQDVQNRTAPTPPTDPLRSPSDPAGQVGEGPGQRSRRRRRRRGRRGSGPVATFMGGVPSEGETRSSQAQQSTSSAPADSADSAQTTGQSSEAGPVSHAQGTGGQPAEPVSDDQASPRGSDLDRQ